MKKGLCLVFILWLAMGAVAYAGLNFVPNTYGMSARSVGLGNAMAAVGDDYSMTYYNPAALGALKNHQIDLSYMYAAPGFEGGPNGDEVEFDEANKLTFIGFTMNLSDLFSFEHGLGLGFDIILDDNLKSMMSFNEIREEDGQFARYGLTSVSMIAGLGVEIIEQLYFGAGAYVMIKGENVLIAETDMAGNTREEEIEVSAEPVMAPIVSIFAPVHPLVTLGAVYRGAGLAEFSAIDATTDAMVSESSLTKLNLLMAFKDTYVPQNVSFGVAIHPMERFLISVEGTWYNWGEYDDEIAKDDVVRSDAMFTTHDTYVPRLGLEYSTCEMFTIRGGYYFEDTPFSDPGIGNTAILDNAKQVFSLGLTHNATYASFMAEPPSIGLSYFLQHLVPRSVETDDGRELESSGDLHGIIGTITLKF